MISYSCENICNNKRFSRISLVLIFFTILFFTLIGEKVPLNDGMGWDGMNYFRTVQSFTELIANQGYDRYAIQRIMPWGLVNIVFKFFNIETSSYNALFSAVIINVVALLLSIFYFFRISDLKKWKISTEIVAFASLFYSYAILKVTGYYVMLSDNIGFLWGMMLVYYFLSEKRLHLLVLSILGIVNWPTVALISGLVLYCLPRNEIKIQSSLKGVDAICYDVVLWGLTLLPILYQLISIIAPPIHDFHFFQYDGRPKTNIVVFLISIVCVCAYWYYHLSPFKLSITNIIKDIKVKELFLKLLVCLLIYLVSNTLLYSLANDGDNGLNMLTFFKKLLISGTTNPFSYVESYFAYYGPIIILIILLWRESVKYIVKKGMGYFCVIILSIFFFIFPEARVSIMFIPFMVLPIIEYIDSLKLKKWVPYLYVIACLILSHVWFPINADGMESALFEDSYASLSKFPAQRIFMCSGIWQNDQMYMIFMAITCFIGIILFMGIKNKWFINNSKL